jgi:hypothetical protein
VGSTETGTTVKSQLRIVLFRGRSQNSAHPPFCGVKVPSWLNFPKQNMWRAVHPWSPALELQQMTERRA